MYEVTPQSFENITTTLILALLLFNKSFKLFLSIV